MVLVTDKTNNNITQKVGMSSGVETKSSTQALIIKLIDNDNRTLLDVAIKTNRGVIILLECIKMATLGGDIKSRLKDIQQNYKSEISIKGKTGEDHEQLQEKPDPEDELGTLGTHLTLLKESEIWDIVINKGLCNLLPA